MDALRASEHALSDPALAAQAEALGLQVANRLVSTYLRRRHPRLHRLAAVLTLIDPIEILAPAPPPDVRSAYGAPDPGHATSFTLEIARGTSTFAPDSGAGSLGAALGLSAASVAAVLGRLLRALPCATSALAPPPLECRQFLMRYRSSNKKNPAYGRGLRQ